ncbi:MAG: hypothetical protein V2A53_00190 [bacterium]
MTTTSIKETFISQLDELSPALQLSVFNFAKALIPKGVTGKSLLRFEGAIPTDDLEIMAKAIEESLRVEKW